KKALIGCRIDRPLRKLTAAFTNLLPGRFCMSRRLTVSRRIALGFLLIILVMVGLAANSWLDFTTIGRSLSELITTSDSATHLEQLSSQITTEGFAIDDLVISTDENAMTQAKGILAGAR